MPLICWLKKLYRFYYCNHWFCFKLLIFRSTIVLLMQSMMPWYVYLSLVWPHIFLHHGNCLDCCRSFPLIIVLLNYICRFVSLYGNWQTRNTPYLVSIDHWTFYSMNKYQSHPFAFTEANAFSTQRTSLVLVMAAYKNCPSLCNHQKDRLRSNYCNVVQYVFSFTIMTQIFWSIWG